MTRKRDGPRIAAGDQGPEQRGHERPTPLPQRKTPRNTPQGHTSPSSHPRVRRRQGDPSWRTFRVRLVTKPGADGATALYAYLRAAAKRFGLAIASVDEVRDRGEGS